MKTALLAAVAAIAVLLGIGVAAGGDPEVAPTASTAPTSAAAPTTDVELEAAAADEAAALAETDEGTAATRDPGTGLLSDADAASVVAAAGPTTALAALAALPVQGRAPKTGYERDLFGAGWVDTDRNGCDTRNDVLARDLTGEAFKAGTRDCVVLSGTLAEPYAGVTLTFQRGQGTSELVQIDHVVSLSNSWQTGAQGWDDTRRTQFANDPLNLLAVDGRLNQQKGDGDTATWLPPNRSYRCDYVARQVAVKVSYGLWTTQAEHNAMATVLSSCPDQLLPDGVVAVLPAPVATAAPGTPAPTAAPPDDDGSRRPGPGPGARSGPGHHRAPGPGPGPHPGPCPCSGAGSGGCLLRELRRGPRGGRGPGVPR
ncbi:DUF1524 domain-containing protein [Geodermatophilaceae bacterium NBWT11]|nr:DUF1524 domain-containing protein [Geodermatophilaceae bacterium NBWT11]